MYTLILDTNVLKYLEKLPLTISRRIFTKITQTKSNPHRYFIRLTNRPEYKLRIGDYRVIADINDTKITIYVVFIEHRSSVYKN